MKKALIAWLPYAGITTILCLIIYASVQQNYRQNANDPQVQIAEDAALTLANAPAPSSIPGFRPIDISKSLGPYIIIFDADGKPLVTSATLDNKTPLPPSGVFSYLKNHGEDRFTWEPAPGVRSAAVMVKFAGSHTGSVLVGRSLREVEIRERNLSFIVCIGWAAALVAGLLYFSYIYAIRTHIHSLAEKK